jgi:hypothetical protein
MQNIEGTAAGKADEGAGGMADVTGCVAEDINSWECCGAEGYIARPEVSALCGRGWWILKFVAFLLKG